MREEQAHHCRLAQILSLQSPQRAASEISLFPLCICSLSAELSCSFSPQDGTRKRTSSLFQKGCFFFFSLKKSLLQLSDSKHNFVKIHLWGSRWEYQ